MYIRHSFNTYLFRLRGSDLGQRGNSGGAVFSDQEQMVVGIQTEAAKSRVGPESDVVLAIPLYRIAQEWEPLQKLAEGCLRESDGAMAPKGETATPPYLSSEVGHPLAPSPPLIRCHKFAVIPPKIRCHTPSPPRLNPYTTRAILKNRSLFVGRAAELGRIFMLLAGMQSCSVVGARRIGKSSLLYYLMAPEIYAAFLPHAASYVIAFLDLQELAGLEPDEFFEIAVEQLERASGRRLKVDLARDGTRRGFRRFLRRVTDQGLRLVLCCDEFEFLSQNPDFGANFFVYLRGLCSNYNLAIVTSSRASLYDLCHQGNIETSQFWNIFTEIGLGLMPEEEARTLISQPFARAKLSQSDEEAAFVLDLAGQHPFFIQIACYHLFTARLAGKNATLSLIERRFLDEARPHYAYAWQQLNEAAQSTLLALLRHDEQTVDATIFRQLQRNALLTGSPQAPSVVSRGWQEFLRSVT